MSSFICVHVCMTERGVGRKGEKEGERRELKFHFSFFRVSSCHEMNLG